MAISPGITTKIIDLSEYVRNVPGTIGYIPIICEEGPDNQLISTNAKDFFIDFGTPDINYAGKAYSQGPYIAQSFLRESDSLYVCRCLPTDAAWSNIILSAEATSEVGADGTANITSSSVAGINTDAEITTNVEDDTNACVMFYGVGRGEYYNNFKIKVSQDINPEKTGVYVVDIYKKQADPDPVTGADQFEIIGSYEVSFDYRELDDAGDSMFIEDVINRYSRFIKCKADKDKCLTAITNGADFSEPFVSGSVALANGDSGTLFDENGLVDSTTATQVLTQAYNGTLPKTNGDVLYEVLDTDNVYFNLVFDGGYPSDVKTSGVYTLTTTREDCVGIIDNGDNAMASAAVTARDNTHVFNTKYLAMYEPYSKVYDSFTGRDIWVSPVYHMAAIIAKNDKVAEQWYAPAGFNRGAIGDIKELRYNALRGDRDTFYLKQINPLVKFNVGYSVFGQLTTQKKPSALQDLNILRLVLYCKRAISQFCENFIFEQNDSVTWSRVSAEVKRFLVQVQNKRGLDSFTVSVGANDYEKKSKSFRVDVTLQPTRTTERINLNFFIK